MHYKIRFENTGSAEAVNIVVKDVINTAMFDISTLQPIDASHDFVTRIKDKNMVEFIFENIMLPFDDANNDGYITFKIKTLETLAIGDTFENNAEIYFDFNFPIITETAITSIETLSIQEVATQTTKVELYPNPVVDVLKIKADGNIKTIKIYHTNGKLLEQNSMIGNNTNAVINAKSWAKGVYFVQLETENGVAEEKVLKR